MPWYYQFLTPYFLLYFLPIYCSLKCLYTPKRRIEWQAWWVELALAEFAELLLFKEHARSMLWWPKVSKWHRHSWHAHSRDAHDRSRL